MNAKSSMSFLGSVAVVALLVSSAFALDEHRPVHFSGLINDFTPSQANGGPSGGPWEMHGRWTLDLRSESGRGGTEKGDFSADMTMSDLGTTTVGTPPVTVLDPTKPGNSPHTHHILLTNATVTFDEDKLAASCPKDSPATTPRFMLSGTVSIITGNGNTATFEATNPPSPPTSVLLVCVTGGDPEVDPYSVPYSNITLQFETGSKAIKHFGADSSTTQAIHGVINKYSDR